MVDFRPTNRQELDNAINLLRHGNMSHGAIGGWNVSRITDMSHLFENFPLFNQSIEKWDVGQVTSMNGMFAGCHRFNQPLNSWNVSNVIDFTSMFEDCTNFNQPLDQWSVAQGVFFNRMFLGCKSFYQYLPWDMSNVNEDQTDETVDMFLDSHGELVMPWNKPRPETNDLNFLIRAKVGLKYKHNWLNQYVKRVFAKKKIENMTLKKSDRIKQSVGRPANLFYPGDPGSRMYREALSDFNERNLIDESPTETLRKLKKRIKTATNVKVLAKIAKHLPRKALTRKARASFAHSYPNSNPLQDSQTKGTASRRRRAVPTEKERPTLQEQKKELLKYL